MNNSNLYQQSSSNEQDLPAIPELPKMNFQDNNQDPYIDIPPLSKDTNSDNNKHRSNRTISKLKKHRALSVSIAVLLLLSGFTSGTAFASYRFSTKLDSMETVINNLNHNTLALSSVGEKQTNELSDIIADVSPSVVGITITIPATLTSRGVFVWEKPESEVSGSGFIMNYDGYIATNYHVVEEGVANSESLIQVTLADGRTAKAEYVGGDKQNDLAVLKINLDNLSPVSLGDSSTLMIGNTAIAIGNPLGSDFAGSATAGIISGINRNLNNENTAESMIQTDAAINPGNSGGPLLNSAGEVIGINTVKIASTEVEGIGFAIPINYAYPILESLMNYGYVKGRPATGLNGSAVTSVMSRYYQVPTGFLVESVDSDSAAEHAGIKPGDILTSLNGKSISDLNDIKTVCKDFSVGDTISAEIYRTGNTYTLPLTLTEEKGN